MTINAHSPTLTTSAAAEILHVSVDTLRRWADKGFVDFYRTAGGHRRYNRSDIMILARQQHALEELDGDPAVAALKQMLVPTEPKPATIVAYRIEYKMEVTWEGSPGNTTAIFNASHTLQKITDKRTFDPESIANLLTSGYTYHGHFPFEPAIEGEDTSIYAGYSLEKGFSLTVHGDITARTEELALSWLQQQIDFQKQRLGKAKPQWGIVSISNPEEVDDNIWYFTGKEETNVLQAKSYDITD